MSNVSISDAELLKFAIENGMIDTALVQEKIEMQKRKELLEKHPYSIWEDDNGEWHTYLPNKEKGRVHRRRKSQAAICDVIVEYWKRELENPTIKDVYDEWAKGKLDREEISWQTKNRYDRQFDESMKDFGERRIKSIEPLDIEDFLLNAIHEHSLTQKGYSNLRTLIYGIFRRAKKRGLVSFSITEIVKDMEISRKSFRKIQKQDEELVFMEDEVPKVIDYIMQGVPDIIALGILLLFKTGLRPGELVALKWCDISKNIIHVCRTEIRYSTDTEKNIYEVRDFPKTEAGDRDVVLPERYMWIIKSIRRLNPFGEYVFEKNGKRIKSYQISQRLETICNKTGITRKSPNKIRKTYGTILIDSNVDESVVISQMGHTNIKTTKTHYYKNRKSMEQKTVTINNVSAL